MPPFSLASSTASFAPLRVGWPSAAAPPESGSVTPILSVPFVAPPLAGAPELHAAKTNTALTASAPNLESFIRSPLFPGRPTQFGRPSVDASFDRP
jgi:hypothetical protein